MVFEKKRLKESNNKVCEAVDCYEAATETVAIAARKYGIIKFKLCHKCAVTKFQNTPSGDIVIKESKETVSKDDDLPRTPQTRRVAPKKETINNPIHNHDLFNHVMKQLIAALDKLDLLKEMRDK